MASRIIAIPLLCISVAGLTSFLLYVYTGRRWIFAAVGGFYAVVTAFFYWVTFTLDQAVVVQEWLVGVDDTHPPYRAAYVLVGVPPILAAAAYLALLRHSDRPLQRYRIALIATSLITYIGGGMAARLAGDAMLIFLSLVIGGFVAGIASILAYYPPSRVAAWLEPDAMELARRRMREVDRWRRLEELL